MNKKKFVIAVVFSLLMVGSAIAVVALGSSGTQAALNGGQNSPVLSASPSTTSSTPWQMPTNTMHEPSYTNGTFKMGIDCNVNSLNPFQETTYCDAYVVEELYDGLFNTLPDGHVVPWVATNYSVAHVTTNNQTYDITTNSTANYSYVYTINLRPYVQWTDWTPANASDTYTFSNTVHFNYNGKPTSHTYSSFKTTTMKTYYVQSGDIVQSWRMQSSCGDWPNVVNVIPNGNLSVKVFVTHPTLLLFSTDFENNILPYHIWIKHDFTSIPGLYNCTPNIKSGNGWYDWNMGWNSATGRSPGSVGTGPFMVQNSYGLPQGAIVPSHHETMYVNPHYFVQYANKTSGLRQYTPKFYEIYEPFFSSESSMIAAYQKGQIDTTSLAPNPSFLPQVQSTPGSYIYHKTSSAYGYFRINTRVAPLNVTAFRQALNYATPTSYIASTIDDGYGILSSNPVNPGNTLYYNSSSPMYTLNMAKAQSLLKSIPGMANVSGTLEYYGKAVVITIQTTVGSVAPDNILGIQATEKYWNELGIKVNLQEEAFTTLIANIDGSISSNNNLYQIGSLGISTPIGNPALDCRDSLNPKFGIPTESFVGPFSSMTVNGKNLNGTQVQSLFNNMTATLVNTNSVTQAEHVAKRLQTLMIRQATMVNLGYGVDLIPEQTSTFANYSHTNPDAVYIYWYWQFFSIYSITPVKVHYNYTLEVKASLNNATKEYAGDMGSITFTVTNSSTTKPVSGATVLVGVSASYGGILNITSNTLTTNSAGQAVWKYEVTKLSTLFVTSNSQNNLVNLYYEEANVTAVALQPNAKNTGYAKQTGPGNATQTLWLINPSLDVSCTFSSSVYTPGEKGNITFTVTKNGTAYAGATITITASTLQNITYNKTDLTLTTNSNGMAVFNFTVQSNISTVLAGTDFGNTTMSIMVVAPSSAHLVGANATVAIPLTVAPPPPKISGLSTLDYIIIGVVVAVVVVAGAAAFVVMRKPKVKS
ncbi:MAG: ABC transporter substrate-binding protein [Cuniculiplasma sp.]